MTPIERKKLADTLGYIHSWESFGTVDGPGVRVVFFLQGCPLRCLYCHNPDSVPVQGGQPWTAGQLTETATRYQGFMRGGGVTLSGGEPLMQAEFCTAAITLLQEKGIHVAVDTSGCIPLARSRKAIDIADLLLLDIKGHEPEACKALTGNDGNIAWETLNYCESIKKPVWIRHVLLRGYTLNTKALSALADRLMEYTCIERVELLPFHKMGEYKWQKMGRSYQLSDIEATTAKETEEAKAIFTTRGFEVQ